jgi:hypothetical protein
LKKKELPRLIGILPLGRRAKTLMLAGVKKNSIPGLLRALAGQAPRRNKYSRAKGRIRPDRVNCRALVEKERFYL